MEHAMTDADVPSDGPVFDPVTGAHPRALLRPRLDNQLARTAGTGGRCSVFLFDVDFFKSVNDAYGHLRGDRVLRELADQIKITIRRVDTLFRYGGDEFVVMLPDTDRSEALRCALRLTDTIRRHEFDGKPPLRLSISLGVATFPDDGSDSEALLTCADRRNYLAKRRGRDGVVGDDVETDTGPLFSRLWERDTELRVVHEFLTRLQAEGTGTLHVTGEAGAGHTRFLAEIATIATLRGFVVRTVPAEPTANASPSTAQALTGSVLLIADTGARDRAGEAVATARTTRPAILGLVRASTGGYGPVDGEDPMALPLVATAELKPWSTATLRIWLRNTLRGEPSRTLLSWIAAESGGLPAAAVRALQRLRARNGLVPASNGGWTVSASVLGRPSRRATLPIPLTDLIGRETDRDRVAAMLTATRLVTLVGPGGIGKTRLSLAVAMAVSERFDEGAVFVPLADTTDDDQVVAAIVKGLRVTVATGESQLEAVVGHLGDASLLLILDNFEQVIETAPIISTLLAAAPRVSILVTSRERLAIYGEQVFRVPPLSLPDLATLPAGPDRVPTALAESPAVALFVRRAKAADFEFALTAENLPVVIDLCRHLDGLPLAIELAAARVDRWRPSELLEHLSGHLDVSGRGPRDRPARQRSLRGAIDWSYALLEAEDQLLFETLAVFVGGGTLAAVRAVSDAGDHLTDHLNLLVEKSLLVARREPDSTARYQLLETIRVYAVGRLARRDEAAAVHDRHARYFVTFAQQCGEGMTGPEQAEWTERLERDYDNLRAALMWLLDHGETVLAAGICLGLWRYWRNGSNLTEGRDWLSQVLLFPEQLSTPVHARVLHAAAVLASSQDDHGTADRLARQSLDLARLVGDRHTTAQAHNALGIAAMEAGEAEKAAEHFRQSLLVCQDLNLAQGTAIALGNLTKVALRRGDIAAADEYTRRCLALERAVGDTRGVVMALEAIGQIRLVQGDVAGARDAFRESLELSRTLGDVFGEATSLHGLGLTAHAEGKRDEALRLLIRALARRHEVGEREDLAVSLDRVAGLMVSEDPALAARLLAAAGELRLRHRLPDPPEHETQREETLARIHEVLDEPALTAVWEAGRGTALDRVIDQVLDLVPDLY
jgi:diguanylate cyclase (GGDEF)-like protein